ncbi:GIN domain-containing protein [Rhizorhapis sp.]|uniref:GIN domain-containing protein n=1 Tax=Rhizorhapis sp. TaxID=1968842 RepID=UPI002B46E9CE|nr:DUF2807 domain-containing protein [Rhizorhapis sp.]HKR16285.1 DUF2807 domain-containing protein [Rhizorhapis sp.]
MIRKILAAMAGLTVAVAGPAFAAQQQYSVTDFHTVRMQAPFRVVVLTGKGNSAQGEGARDALDRVSLSVSGGVLTIRAAASRYGEQNRNAGAVELLISTPAVRRVIMGGDGSLSVHGMRGVRGDISMAGNGDLEVDGVAVDQLVVNSAGGGRIRLSGRAGQARVQVIGAGNIEAPGLVAKDLVLDSQGPGSIALSASGMAEVTVKGAGDVKVLGPAACKVSQAGSGLVECGR